MMFDKIGFDIIDAPQRSPEWFASRLGRLTGSRASDMLATIKSGEAAARRDYRMQLVCERLTEQLQEDVFVNAAMTRGIECEPLAFKAYEAHTGQIVERSGFLSMRAAMAGCSLDGHVEDFTGIVEMKCPKSATHLRYLRAGTVPSEHLAQITHNLWVTGADWCDFVSWDDRFPNPLQLFVVRLSRDDRAIAEYAEKAATFLREVALECDAVSTLGNLRGVLQEVL